MSKKRAQAQHNGVDNVPGFFTYLENTSGDVYVRAEGGGGGIWSSAFSACCKHLSMRELLKCLYIKKKHLKKQKLLCYQICQQQKKSPFLEMVNTHTRYST